MNKIEKQNARDAKVEELLLKVDFLVELIQEQVIGNKPAKDVIKKAKEKKYWMLWS